MPMRSLTAIKTHFERIYPQLFGRIEHYSRRFADPMEATAEMVASAWINCLRKAERTGLLLPPSQLAYVAFIRLKSGRVLCGYSAADVLAEQTFREGRVRVFLLSQMAGPARRRPLSLTDGLANSVGLALTTRERERPDRRAATRIDWAAFVKTLPTRLCRIVELLALDFRKAEIAKRLRLSSGRVSQLLAVIAEKLKEYFGPEIAGLTA